ncbi:hypothetical protein ACIBI3_02735 [Actinomadura luteofluorescens]|uniref:hypothetical protein n=1 Tax=Actinomadura luteofluorescens TaxID=46163 RepID=UPI00347E73C4
MEMKTLEELRRPDERALHFSSWGCGGRIAPEDAVTFQQESVGRFDLAPQVSDRVRNRFEQVRDTYRYGVLNYGLYTAAHDQAYLTLEFALRERFVDFYSGEITVVHGDRTEHRVPVSTFEEVRAHFKRRSGRQTPLLQLLDGQTIRFDGMLDSLTRWARAEKLLHGQRNRHMEPLLVRLRNFVAHEAGDHVTTPPDAALAIRDLAETINQIWGVRTPGGRLYPAPIRREPIVIAWSSDGSSSSAGLAENLQFAAPEPNHDQYAVVLAVASDPELDYFDARYATSSFPKDLLWGPGTWEDAIAWLEQERPSGDEVDVLDQLFVVRYHKRRLYLPQEIDVVAGLRPEEREGIWYFVQADSPLDAFNHLRRLVGGGANNQCSRRGECQQCAVEIIGTGVWQQVVRLLAGRGITPISRSVPDVRVRSWSPRWKENLGNGNWLAPSKDGP